MKDFIPDIILNTQRGELLIEIFVSHQVDIVKKQKVSNYGARMIEIDLRSFANKIISRDDLRNILLSENNLTTWISYPLSKNVIDEARNMYESMDEVKKYRSNQLQKKEKINLKESEIDNLEHEMRIQRLRRINRGTKKYMDHLYNKEMERNEKVARELYRKNMIIF